MLDIIVPVGGWQPAQIGYVDFCQTVYTFAIASHKNVYILLFDCEYKSPVLITEFEINYGTIHLKHNFYDLKCRFIRKGILQRWILRN